VLVTVSWRPRSASSCLFSSRISRGMMIAARRLLRCTWVTHSRHHSRILGLHVSKHRVSISSCHISIIRDSPWDPWHHPKVMIVILHHHSLLLESCLALKLNQGIKACCYDFREIIWICNWNSPSQGWIILCPRVQLGIEFKRIT
jgi:hypothetical protein